jgi:hypothetical protein
MNANAIGQGNVESCPVEAADTLDDEAAKEHHIGHAISAGDLVVGLRVEGLFQLDRKWYPGEIKSKDRAGVC